MDKDERENTKRVSLTQSETKRSHHRIIFAQLRTYLNTHGCPADEEEEKILSSTTDLLRKKEEEEGKPENSKPMSNWTPSFCNYDEFHRMILESLGTFIIIMSTDGVIIYATENVSPLLGYTLDEIVGKKFLSLLPEEEKRDVFQKICLKLPVSNTVGRRSEFCCHLKRRDLDDDDKIIYEHAKFFLCLKDVTDEPLEFLTRFFPSPKYIEASTTELPLEDRFYMVGTVCIIKTQTLWERLTIQNTGQDTQRVEPSDEENSMTKDQMEPMRSASAFTSCDESQESARIPGNSLTSPETTQSSTTTSFQNIEYEPTVEAGYTTVEVEQVRPMEVMEEEPFRIPSPVIAYINKREKELIMRFKRQLEEKTQMLQADLRKQKKELKQMKEQLNTLLDSKSQMQPTMPYHVGSYESQALEPAPKKQRTEQMQKSFADTSETRSFRPLRLPCSIRFSELFKEPGRFHTSTQQYLQKQEQYLQLLQESQPHQCNITVDNQILQIFLPNLPGPLYDDSLFFMQIQSTDAPFKLEAKEQDKNIERQGKKSQSFVPEDQHKQDVPPRTYSTDNYILPARTSELELGSLETTQDYLQLWPETSDPNSKVKYEVKSWPYTSQDQEDSSEPRVSYYYSCYPVEVDQEELTPGEENQETSGPQDFLDTAEDPLEKYISYLSSDQSDSDE